MTTPDRPPAFIAVRPGCGCTVHVTLSTVSGLSKILRAWDREGLQVVAATMADTHRLSLCPHVLDGAA